LKQLNNTSTSFWSKLFDGLLLNVLIRVKGIIYLPILVNYFTKEDIGVLAYVQSISALLLGLYLLNIPDSSNRVILNFEKGGNRNQVENTINTVLTFGAFSLFFVSIIISLFYWFGSDQPSSNFLLILICLCISKVVNKLAIFVFQVFQETKVLLYSHLFIEYTSFILAIILLFFYKIDNIYFVLIVNILVSLFVSIRLLFLLSKKIKIKPAFNTKILKKILKISLFLLPNAYGIILIQNVDFILVKEIAGIRALGEYSFAFSISSIVTGLSLAISFFWYSAAVYAERRKLITMLERIIAYMPLILISVILFFQFCTLSVVQLINEAYSLTSPTINILVIGLTLNLQLQFLNGTLYSQKKEKIIFLITSCGVLINLVLNYTLIPTFGYTGAALATTLSYLTMAIIQLIAVKILFKEMSFTRYFINAISLICISLFAIQVNF
jgi:O-antigen/teichoic acid export membrane protein